MKSLEISRFWRFALIGFFALLVTAPTQAQDEPARKPVLILDTDLAEGKEPEPELREPSPARARQNVNIGNTYFKRRNYVAAISRYIEAISWQQDSIPAHEALARAYEKTGDLAKAILTLQTVIEKNPDSPKNKEFQLKIDALKQK
ncbi:MAG: tetratricopeptide repeat protein [Acidobacteriota bacterium]|nr:tetratricopeptide repeat protein [Acidobacteriota bacterium]